MYIKNAIKKCIESKENMASDYIKYNKIMPIEVMQSPPESKQRRSLLKVLINILGAAARFLCISISEEVTHTDRASTSLSLSLFVSLFLFFLSSSL